MFVRGVQRAVQNLDLRVFNCHLQTGFQKRRRRRKYNGTSVPDGLLQNLFTVILRRHEITLGIDIIRENLLQVKPAQLMGVGPAGGLGRFLMNKRHLLPGTAQQVADQLRHGFLGLDSCGCHLQLQGFFAGKQEKLLPGLLDLFFQLR